jgi:hypothetical protein
VAGEFYVLRFLKKYTVFLAAKQPAIAYGLELYTQASARQKSAKGDPVSTLYLSSAGQAAKMGHQTAGDSLSRGSALSSHGDLCMAPQPGRPPESLWSPPGGAITVLLLASPRIISLPLLLIALIVSRKCPPARAFFAWVVFIASLFSPVDLAVPGIGYPGGLRGHPRSGVRLVRVIVGMPAHTALVRRYREYYSAGCSGFWLVQPRWVVTLQ